MRSASTTVTPSGAESPTCGTLAGTDAATEENMQPGLGIVRFEHAGTVPLGHAGFVGSPV